MFDRQERLARLVYQSAAAGGSVEELVRVSGRSRKAVRLAMTFVDINEEAGEPCPWYAVLALLQATLDAMG